MGNNSEKEGLGIYNGRIARCNQEKLDAMMNCANSGYDNIKKEISDQTVVKLAERLNVPISEDLVTVCDDFAEAMANEFRLSFEQTMLGRDFDERPAFVPEKDWEKHLHGKHLKKKHLLQGRKR